MKWSDGSYQLLIGDSNVIDLQVEDNSMNSQYIASVDVVVFICSDL